MAAYPYRLPRKCRRRPRGKSSAGPVMGAVAVAALVAASGTAKIAHAAALPAGSPEGSAAARAVGYARAELGKPYRWAATGPDAFDCSGLVMEAYAAAGVHVARTSQEQWATETRVPASRVQAGDLVFFAGGDGTETAPGHVGIVVNPAAHTMIDAYAAGYPVSYDTYGEPGSRGGLAYAVGFTSPQGGS